MKFLIIFCVFCSPGLANWATRAKFENFATYFPNLIQETVYELERQHWSNLRLDDLHTPISLQVYDESFEGYADYRNGFLVSIQNIDLDEAFRQHFMTGVINYVTTGEMTGILNFRDVKLGFDVFANITGHGEHFFTGQIVHDDITFSISVQKNYNTSEIVAKADLTHLSSKITTLMQYSPAHPVGEVISRFYTPGSAWNSIAKWGPSTIEPILREQITKLGFPEVCFNC